MAVTTTQLNNNINKVQKELEGLGKTVQTAVKTISEGLGEPMTDKEAVAYLQGLQKDADGDNEKKAEKARETLKKFATEAGVILAPGFFGGLIPFYYAIVHLSSKSNKAKWTGAALLIKDLALIGLAVVTYLSGAKAGETTVEVQDEAGEVMEFAEAA
jgi:hypothetical protein